MKNRKQFLTAIGLGIAGMAIGKKKFILKMKSYQCWNLLLLQQ
jgi:hypothetical protein